MKFVRNKKTLVKFIVYLLSIQVILTQNISELIQPKCTDNKIEYSIVANMKEYLEHENNIDGRELYSTIDDLKSKKVGTLSFFSLDDFTNVEKYDSLDDLMEALRKHKVDAIFVDNALANYTQVLTNDLSQIEGKTNVIFPAIVCQKDSGIHQKIIEFREKAIKNGKYHEAYYQWMGIDEEGLYINKTLSRNEGVLKALVFNHQPYVFKNENGELVGSLIQFLYGFARINGYQVELKETSSIDELNQAIKDKTYDIVSYFIQDNNTSDENSYFLFEEQELNPIIRYSNYHESTEWAIYDSFEQYNGEKLGCLNGYSLEYLYKELFPKSEVKYYDNDYDLLYFLLREEIEGYLTDENIAKNMEKKFPERITYFDVNITSDIAFGFKKNDDTLLNEFNEFLKSQDVEKLYEKWDVDDASNIVIEKDNYKGEKTIKAGFLIDSKPFSFIIGEDFKGIEIELLYEFAKSKNYNVDLEGFTNTEDRMKIGEADTDFDITGGEFTITEERAKTVSFSNPVYKLGTSLIVRRDTRKDTMKLSIFDNEYNQISDNTAKLYSKVGDKTVTSFCAFPEIYNYTLTINCLIDDFNGTDPFTQGIEITETEDKLRIVYTDLEINNILKANEKLKLTIIEESDKTEHICPEEKIVGETEEREESNTSLISAIVGGSAAIIGILVSILSFCL